MLVKKTRDNSNFDNLQSRVERGRAYLEQLNYFLLLRSPLQLADLSWLYELAFESSYIRMMPSFLRPSTFKGRLMMILGKPETLEAAESLEKISELLSQMSPGVLLFLRGFLFTHQQMKKMSVVRLKTTKNAA